MTDYSNLPYLSDRNGSAPSDDGVILPNSPHTSPTSARGVHVGRVEHSRYFSHQTPSTSHQPDSIFYHIPLITDPEMFLPTPGLDDPTPTQGDEILHLISLGSSDPGRGVNVGRVDQPRHPRRPGHERRMVAENSYEQPRYTPSSSYMNWMATQNPYGQPRYTPNISYGSRIAAQNSMGSSDRHQAQLWSRTATQNPREPPQSLRHHEDRISRSPEPPVQVTHVSRTPSNVNRLNSNNISSVSPPSKDSREPSGDGTAHEEGHDARCGGENSDATVNVDGEAVHQVLLRAPSTESKLRLFAQMEAEGAGRVGLQETPQSSSSNTDTSQSQTPHPPSSGSTSIPPSSIRDSDQAEHRQDGDSEAGHGEHLVMPHHLHIQPLIPPRDPVDQTHYECSDDSDSSSINSATPLLPPSLQQPTNVQHTSVANVGSLCYSVPNPPAESTVGVEGATLKRKMVETANLDSGAVCTGLDHGQGWRCGISFPVW